MRRRTDVPDALHGRPVWSTPEEVLVERQRPAVRVAADEVDVDAPEIGRRDRDAVDDRALEVRDVSRHARLDAVGVPFAQLGRPDAVPRVELAGGVALHLPGKLLELHPE